MESTKYAIYAFVTYPEHFERSEAVTDDELIEFGASKPIFEKFETLSEPSKFPNDYQYSIYAYVEELHGEFWKILTPNELITQGPFEQIEKIFKELTGEDIISH